MSQPLRPPPQLETEDPLEDTSGNRLGPYLLLRRLGHGGMGSIYLAERQDEYHQQVAVKVMHKAFVSQEMQLRFRTERQALARLEHPNIARLDDGGTSDEGLPFLVMELIDGAPIDRYCDRHRLTVARLGRPQEAEPLLRRSLAELTQAFGEDHRVTVEVRQGLSRLESSADGSE